jgi:predicted nucleic acid-binding Zn ribbon protein
MDNKCVCCGKPIPEGRQVCHKCEDITDKLPLNNFKSNKGATDERN